MDSLNTEERRLSVNGRNAYVFLNGDNFNVNKNISDPNYNKNYLTAKINERSRSCSPLLSCEKIKSSVTTKTTACLEHNTKECENLPTTMSKQTNVKSPQRTIIITPSALTTPTTSTNVNDNGNVINTGKTVSCNNGTSSANQLNRLNFTPDKICIFNKKSAALQTGMDRYITITKKRKLSPQKAKSAKVSKAYSNSSDSDPPTTSSRANRFAILGDDTSDNRNNGTEGVPPASNARPPPIFLREAISSDLVKEITDLIGNNNFHVVSQKGSLKETKIQIYNETNYRIFSNYLNKSEKSYYTYQLKSSKGLVVVIKGIESNVDPGEIKSALNELGFDTKMVINIFNKNKVPQPMFKVELAPNASKLKRNEVHPIYSLRYLLHRRVQVEEPHKRHGPVQCTNCQEFGHTKTYCTLRPVCVACGDIHKVSECKLSKEDSSNRKCGNCGGNHTANYRGCPVYVELKKRLNQRMQTIRYRPANGTSNAENNNVVSSVVPGVSYANAVNNVRPNLPHSNENQTPNLPQNSVGLESTMNAFIQTMNVFMTTMAATMQDLSKTQSQMLQILMVQK